MGALPGRPLEPFVARRARSRRAGGPEAGLKSSRGGPENLPRRARDERAGVGGQGHLALAQALLRAGGALLEDGREGRRRPQLSRQRRIAGWARRPCPCPET